MLSILAAVVTKKARDALNKSKQWGIQGNMKGDGFQTGGTLIVSQGGKNVLLDFRQESPGDHAALADILKALSIDEPVPPPLTQAAGSDGAKGDAAAGGEGEPKPKEEGTKKEKKMECNEDVCQMK